MIARSPEIVRIPKSVSADATDALDNNARPIANRVIFKPPLCPTLYTHRPHTTTTSTTYVNLTPGHFHKKRRRRMVNAMFPDSPTSVTTVAQIIQLAVAPVFLLAGIGAFLNVCAGRLSRIVDRSREIEPLLIASRGTEHDRWLGEIRVLDRRMALVSRAIFLSVLAAVLICAVVVLLFAAGLVGAHFGTAIALLFIASMVAIGLGFAIFLVETRVGSRAVRIRSELLAHEVEPD